MLWAGCVRRCDRGSGNGRVEIVWRMRGWVGGVGEVGVQAVCSSAVPVRRSGAFDPGRGESPVSIPRRASMSRRVAKARRFRALAVLGEMPSALARSRSPAPRANNRRMWASSALRSLPACPPPYTASRTASIASASCMASRVLASGVADGGPGCAVPVPRPSGLWCPVARLGRSRSAHCRQMFMATAWT